LRATTLPGRDPRAAEHAALSPLVFVQKNP